MRPTRAEALRNAMNQELDGETYERIMERAKEIRGEW
jgi:predicted RNase H-like HicB family nuclease